jgi:hypothetical protein
MVGKRREQVEERGHWQISRIMRRLKDGGKL